MQPNLLVLPGKLLLLTVVAKDCRTVLRAAVNELAVRVYRVDVAIIITG